MADFNDDLNFGVSLDNEPKPNLTFNSTKPTEQPMPNIPD